MTLVIDASIAVKWYFEQTESEAAREIAASDDELIAPELIYAELSNAVWKYVQLQVITADDAHNIVPKVLLRIDRFAPLSALALQAFSLAVRLNHPIYDCFYLALAENENATLVTADQKLARAAQNLSGITTQLLR